MPSHSERNEQPSNPAANRGFPQSAVGNTAISGDPSVGNSFGFEGSRGITATGAAPAPAMMRERTDELFHGRQYHGHQANISPTIGYTKPNMGDKVMVGFFFQILFTPFLSSIQRCHRGPYLTHDQQPCHRTGWLGAQDLW